MTASLKAEIPTDALSTEGLEHLLEGGVMSPDVEMPPADLGGDMWTVEDAIQRLGITKRTVLRKIKNSELTGYKVPGVYGPEWRLYPPTLGGDKFGDLSLVTRVVGDQHLVTPAVSNDLIEELRKQVLELKTENQSLQKDLQGANWRNGYLESQAETKDQQIKLLTDSQHKGGWWARFSSWFLKGQ